MIATSFPRDAVVRLLPSHIPMERFCKVAVSRKCQVCSGLRLGLSLLRGEARREVQTEWVARGACSDFFFQLHRYLRLAIFDIAPRRLQALQHMQRVEAHVLRVQRHWRGSQARKHLLVPMLSRIARSTVVSAARLAGRSVRRQTSGRGGPERTKYGNQEDEEEEAEEQCVALLGLRLLQQLCENHFNPMQSLMLSQPSARPARAFARPSR